MPAATKSLQTSGAQLKAMLANTGRSLKEGDHWEKLDICGFIAEQIQEKLKRGGKIKLTLSDLNAFLSLEGMGQDTDFKGVVSKIIQLVYHQRERLGQHVRPRAFGRVGGESGLAEHALATDHKTEALDSLLALVAMDSQHVNECFEPEVALSPTVVKRPRAAAVTMDTSAEPAAKRLCDSRHVDECSESEVATTPLDEQKRPHAAETMSSHAGPAAKRPCPTAITGSSEAPIAEFGLLAELKRLVPIDMLSIEDIDRREAPTDSLSERQISAQREVDRILQADLEGQVILVGDTAEERRVTFRCIVLLLHPDLGFVSGKDARAIKALELSLKAFVRSELSCGE